MGWDAFAKGPKGGMITNSEIKHAFRAAQKLCMLKAKGHDIHIGKGYVALDCSQTAEMLKKACGKSPWDPNPWHPKLMTFNWDFEYKKELAWAYWSAKKFIDVCQEFNLTIKFSW